MPVAGSDGPVLTPDVQQRMMARDDWVFWAERYLLGCVSTGPFHTAGEVTQRIGAVLGIVAAILAGGGVPVGEDRVAQVDGGAQPPAGGERAGGTPGWQRHASERNG
jgi:hypothetical protein